MGAARRLGHGALPQMWQPDPHRERRPRTLGSRPQRHQPLAPRDGRAPTVQQKNLGAPGRAEERTQLTAAAGASAEPRRLRRARTEDRGGPRRRPLQQLRTGDRAPGGVAPGLGARPGSDRPCPAEYSADELPRPRIWSRDWFGPRPTGCSPPVRWRRVSASRPRRSCGAGVAGRSPAGSGSTRTCSGSARPRSRSGSPSWRSTPPSQRVRCESRDCRRWRPRCGGGT